MNIRTSWMGAGLGLVFAAGALAAWPWPKEWKWGRGEKTGRAVTNRIAAAEAQEALMAAPVLAEENDRLRAQVETLQAQVGALTVSLAEARFESDRLKVQLEQLPAETTAAGAAELGSATIAVADVNRGLGLVVLDAGASAGVRPGMVFGLVRGDQVIGRARTVDVRERIAGAKVEALTSDVYPEKGDRAVVWRSTMR